MREVKERRERRTKKVRGNEGANKKDGSLGEDVKEDKIRKT